MRRRLLLASLAFIALAVAPTAVASAAEYEVEVCTPTATGGHGMVFSSENSEELFNFSCGTPADGSVRQESGEGMSNGAVLWTLPAPQDTTIHTLELERIIERGGFTPQNHTSLSWALEVKTPTGQKTVDLAPDDGSPLPLPSGVIEGIDSTEVTSRLFCGITNCGSRGSTLRVILKDVVAHMRDELPPALNGPLGGSMLAGGELRGTRDVSFDATDRGSGVAKVILEVDGVERDAKLDDNSGHCSKPYQFLQPCDLELSSSLAFDTSQLADGTHAVRVTVFDAAGQTISSNPIQVTFHNRPQKRVPPSLSGAAVVGGQLSADPGNWEGRPSFEFKWLRCPASVTTAAEAVSCAPVAAASAARYQPTNDDLNQREMVEVTAINANGRESAFSAPSDVVSRDSVAPVLSSVALSRTRFRVGRASTAIAAAAGRSRRGTVLRFSSSEAGRLSIEIERVRRGGKARHTATLTRTIAAGPGRVALSGRIARKPMAPGRYRLTVTASDAAGNVSAATRRQFAVLAG
jgi:hypothetical protein